MLRQTNRLAAIDLGTNTVQLVVADVLDTQQKLQLETVTRQSVLIGLGEDVVQTGSIGATKARETRNTLASMVKAARKLGASRVICLATDALRNAGNTNEMLSYWTKGLGVSILLIDGKQEAVLTYWGALSEGIHQAGIVTVADLGGGSCEFVAGEQSEPIWLQSIPLGTSRLLQACIPADPPSASDYAALEETVHAILENVPRPKHQVHELVAVGGSATNLLRLKDAANTSNELTLRDLDRIQSTLAFKPAEELSSDTGVELKRIRLLVAGVVAWREIMQWYGIDRLEVAQAGIREGSILAWVRYAENWPTRIHEISDRLVDDSHAH